MPFMLYFVSTNKRTGPVPRTKTIKMTLTIDRNNLENGMCDIERMIADLIKQDLGAKKVSVTCKTRNWQGHTCPEFTGKADGVDLLIFGDVNPYDLEVDPWKYDMQIDYYFVP